MKTGNAIKNADINSLIPQSNNERNINFSGIIKSSRSLLLPLVLCLAFAPVSTNALAENKSKSFSDDDISSDSSGLIENKGESAETISEFDIEDHEKLSEQEIMQRLEKGHEVARHVIRIEPVAYKIKKEEELNADDKDAISVLCKCYCPGQEERIKKLLSKESPDESDYEELLETAVKIVSELKKQAEYHIHLRSWILALNCMSSEELDMGSIAKNIKLYQNLAEALNSLIVDLKK